MEIGKVTKYVMYFIASGAAGFGASSYSQTAAYVDPNLNSSLPIERRDYTPHVDPNLNSTLGIGQEGELERSRNSIIRRSSTVTRSRDFGRGVVSRDGSSRRRLEGTIEEDAHVLGGGVVNGEGHLCPTNSSDPFTGSYSGSVLLPRGAELLEVNLLEENLHGNLQQSGFFSGFGSGFDHAFLDMVPAHIDGNSYRIDGVSPNTVGIEIIYRTRTGDVVHTHEEFDRSDIPLPLRTRIRNYAVIGNELVGVGAQENAENSALIYVRFDGVLPEELGGIVVGLESRTQHIEVENENCSPIVALEYHPNSRDFGSLSGGRLFASENPRLIVAGNGRVPGGVSFTNPGPLVTEDTTNIFSVVVQTNTSGLEQYFVNGHLSIGSTYEDVVSGLLNPSLPRPELPPSEISPLPQPRRRLGRSLGGAAATTSGFNLDEEERERVDDFRRSLGRRNSQRPAVLDNEEAFGSINQEVNPEDFIGQGSDVIEEETAPVTERSLRSLRAPLQRRETFEQRETNPQTSSGRRTLQRRGGVRDQRTRLFLESGGRIR